MVDNTLLSEFPEVTMAFAYGSGVFTQQDNENAKDNMLDLLFVVDDSLQWHQENLNRNKFHYSIARVFGPKVITSLQEDLGASIYYNTLVQCQGRLLKYGVISRNRFLGDLVSWRNLYVSGRLHKPIKFLGRCPSDIKVAMETNLNHALQTSLLCLPDHFPDEQLYLLIANLSYAGDFRMIIGEHKNKVANIVQPNLERFRELYAPFLSEDKSLVINNNYVHQKSDIETRYERLKELPGNLKKRIVSWRMGGLKFQQFKDPSLQIQDAVLYSLAHDREKTKALTLKGTRSIVRSSSLSQSLKGILTAGMLKTVVYSGKKLGKMFHGMLK